MDLSSIISLRSGGLVADWACFADSIGNMDVIDLINSTIAMFSGGGDLPQVQGNMTCSQTSTAVVEWKLYGD